MTTVQAKLLVEGRHWVALGWMPPPATADAREWVWTLTLEGADGEVRSVRVLEYTPERAAQRAIAIHHVLVGHAMEYPIRVHRDQVTKYNDWRSNHCHPEGMN